MSKIATSRVFLFGRAYVKSMRLYYGFVTAYAGWVGMAYTREDFSIKSLFALVLLFIGWGVNQIVNDYLGLAEDRINAPHRPMVTGELAPLPALMLSAAVVLAASIACYLVSPVSIAFLLIPCGLNVVYEFAKGVPLLGNIVFGVMIATCAFFGITFLRPDMPLITQETLALFVCLVLCNSTMTYYTYFKDFAGDKAAGKRTIVVLLGLERSARLGLIMTALPFLAALYFARSMHGSAAALWAITLFLAGFNAKLFLDNPVAGAAGAHYYNLRWTFRICSLFQVALGALYQPQVGVLLFLASYVGIGALFSLHKDAKA